MAICLAGLHFVSHYKHFTGELKNINYKEYVKNIKTKIYDYFEKNYHIDTFICTEISHVFDELCKTYLPVKYCIDDRNKNTGHYGGCFKKLKVLELLLDHIHKSNKHYDTVLLTRFDIYILKNFTNENLNLNKLNIVSVLENDNVCDDNLFIFPSHDLVQIIDMIRNQLNKHKKANSIHLLKNTFEKKFHVNYICNDKYNLVNKLTFFKLRFFDNVELILNKFLFTENVMYNSINRTSQILIHDNIIEFKKIINNSSPFNWIGYELEKTGFYILSFEIHSNKNIINYDFIKMHKPVKFYKTNNILANVWTKIVIFIEIREPNDLLCFIFDDFHDNIEILYKNIYFHSISNLSTIKEKKYIMQNGFIVNEMKINNENEIHKSNHCFLIKTNEFHEFIKEETFKIVTHIWCGYKIRPEKVKTIMKFDILFLSDVPNKSDNMFIKTHDPEKHYNDWLLKCKKNEFVHIELELFLGKSDQLVIFIMDECLKPIHFIVKNIEFIADKTNYKFISFYTQGEPYDKCFDLTRAVNTYKNSIEKYMDSTRFYNSHELKHNSETAYLVKEFENEPKYNLKTHLIGYLRWKPYIILKTLLESNDGDIIYYRDSNIIKYPEILKDIEYNVETINYVLSNSDIFLPVENYPTLKMKQNVKREVFEYFGLHNHETFESYLLNASIIVCRKSNLIIKFMNEWLDVCKNDNLITSSTIENQHPDFKWNTQEQAIMNILMTKYIKNNLFPHNISKYSVINRLFSVNSLKRVNRVAILLAGEMRNFDNIELIQKNNKYLFELYNCDIFISTWDKKGFSPYHGTINNKKYSDNKIIDNDIKNIYNNIKTINIENYEEWFNKLPDIYKEIYYKGLQCGNKIVNATVFPQLYKIWDCNRLKREYENKNNFQYDLVIRFRSDMCLVEEIPKHYLNDFFDINKELSQNKIFTLNPPKIFYPNRIYDIFFYGNNESMNKLCDSWLTILDCINNPFDNRLPNVDSCRVLYVCCLLNNLNVIDITRCIGDIYRDEPMNEYVNKILHVFN